MARVFVNGIEMIPLAVVVECMTRSKCLYGDSWRDSRCEKTIANLQLMTGDLHAVLDYRKEGCLEVPSMSGNIEGVKFLLGAKTRTKQEITDAFLGACKYKNWDVLPVLASSRQYKEVLNEHFQSVLAAPDDVVLREAKITLPTAMINRISLNLIEPLAIADCFTLEHWKTLTDENTHQRLLPVIKHLKFDLASHLILTDKLEIIKQLHNNGHKFSTANLKLAADNFKHEILAYLQSIVPEEWEHDLLSLPSLSKDQIQTILLIAKLNKTRTPRAIVKNFCSEKIVVEEGKESSFPQIYDAFRQWKVCNGVELNRLKFITEFAALNGKPIERGNVAYWSNLVVN